jgi:hypothetical protein
LKGWDLSEEIVLADLEIESRADRAGGSDRKPGRASRESAVGQMGWLPQFWLRVVARRMNTWCSIARSTRIEGRSGPKGRTDTEAASHCCSSLQSTRPEGRDHQARPGERRNRHEATAGLMDWGRAPFGGGTSGPSSRPQAPTSFPLPCSAHQSRRIWSPAQDVRRPRNAEQKARQSNFCTQGLTSAGHRRPGSQFTQR